MSLAIDIVPKGFEEAKKALGAMNKEFPRALSGAINYGLRAGNTLAAKMITRRYNIKSGDIKAGMNVAKSNYSQLHGNLSAKGPMLPVSLFSPSIRTGVLTPKGVRKVRKGNKARSYKYLSVTIVRGGGKKMIAGAFQGKGRVWERRPVGVRGDAPLGIVSTVGIPFMIGYLGIAKQVENAITTKTAERLEHNVQFELSKKR